jgi:hypothetical protein
VPCRFDLEGALLRLRDGRSRADARREPTGPCFSVPRPSQRNVTIMKRRIILGLLSVGIGLGLGAAVPSSSKAACASTGDPIDCCWGPLSVDYCFVTRGGICVSSLNPCKDNNTGPTIGPTLPALH